MLCFPSSLCVVDTHAACCRTIWKKKGGKHGTHSPFGLGKLYQYQVGPYFFDQTEHTSLVCLCIVFVCVRFFLSYRWFINYRSGRSTTLRDHSNLVIWQFCIYLHRSPHDAYSIKCSRCPSCYVLDSCSI